MASRDLHNFAKFGKKIVGVGFNYKALAAQFKIPATKDPRIYLKAASSYISQGQKIKIPSWSNDQVLYEVELGVVIGRTLKDATPAQVLDHIGGYCVALDMTDKGQLWRAREEGLAWDISKSFDSACPVGEFIPKDRIPDLNNVDLWLRVNGETKQRGNTSDMTWPVPELISIMSRYFTIEAGDMILTGTPAGMDFVSKGDVIEAGFNGISEVRFEVDTA